MLFLAASRLTAAHAVKSIRWRRKCTLASGTFDKRTACCGTVGKYAALATVFAPQLANELVAQRLRLT